MPIPLQKRWEEASGIELNKGWGMTETNAGAIVNLPNRRNLDSIGVPYTNYGIFLAYTQGREALRKVLRPWSIDLGVDSSQLTVGG